MQCSWWWSQSDNSHRENHLVLFAGTPSPPPKKSSYPWAVDGQNPANQFIWKKMPMKFINCFVYPQFFSQIPSTWIPISGCNWNKTLQREPSTVPVGNTLSNDEQAKSHGTDNNELRVKSDAYNLTKKSLTKNHDTSSAYHQPNKQTKQTKPTNHPLSYTLHEPNSIPTQTQLLNDPRPQRHLHRRRPLLSRSYWRGMSLAEVADPHISFKRLLVTTNLQKCSQHLTKSRGPKLQ